MEVALGIPGRTWTHGFGRSMLELVHACMKERVTLHFMQEVSADLYVNRNLTVCPVMMKDKDGKPEKVLYPSDTSLWKPYNERIRPDRIFWIDTDMVFTPDDFFRLVDHDEEMVSGCCMSGPNDLALGYYGFRDNDKQPYLSNLPRYKRDQNGEVFDSFKMWAEDRPNAKGLRVVDYVGLAFVCTKLSVYEKIGYPYFRTVIFKSGDNDVQCSEDVGFCRRVREAGIEIYADPAVRVGHQKMIELRVE
jgi:hypothetical protein